MPALRSRLVQQDFSSGMNRDIAPALIPPTAVYDLVDALLDEDGNPYRRGGTAYKSKEGLGKAGLTWVWDGFLLPGGRTVFANASDFGVLDKDDESVVNLGGAGLTVPKQSAALEDLLFIGGGSIYGGSRKAAAYSAETVEVTKGTKVVTGSKTAWKANVDAGMLFQVGSERVYVVASVDSDTQITLRDNYAGESGGGKAYALYPVYSIEASDPYDSFDYLAICANRVVGLNGRTLKFTEIDNPHSYTNSLSTTNEHTLPEGAEGTGLTTVGQTVLVFTTAGIWTLDGLAFDMVDANGNPQHRLQRLSGEITLASAAGLASSEQRVVVPAADGIYLMDGISSPARISLPIDRLYRQRISDGYRLGGAVVYRGHYFLPIIDGSANVRDLLVCRLDRPVRGRSQTTFPWTRFTGDGGEITAFAVRHFAGPLEPLLLGAQAREPSRVVSCSSYFAPDEDHTTDADGSVHNLDLIMRDVETGGMTENVIRSVNPRYELVGEGKLRVYESDGSLVADSPAVWDEVAWDEFDWAAEESGAVFNALSKEGPPSNGSKPEKFRVNKRRRYGRFRLTTEGAITFFALRSIEIDVRPSQAVRR